MPSLASAIEEFCRSALDETTHVEHVSLDVQHHDVGQSILFISDAFHDECGRVVEVRAYVAFVNLD